MKNCNPQVSYHLLQVCFGALHFIFSAPSIKAALSCTILFVQIVPCMILPVQNHESLIFKKISDQLVRFTAPFYISSPTIVFVSYFVLFMHIVKHQLVYSHVALVDSLQDIFLVSKMNFSVVETSCSTVLLY